MAFPRHLVYDDETVVLDLRPHWWYFSRHIVTGVPLIAFVVGTVSISNSDVRDVVRWPVGLIVLVWALWLSSQFVRWWVTYFVVTDQRVLYRTGVLARHGVEIPLERITNINYHQGIWERIIGAGDLDIESAGEEGDACFRNVRHPDDVSGVAVRDRDRADHQGEERDTGEDVA